MPLIFSMRIFLTLLILSALFFGVSCGSNLEPKRPSKASPAMDAADKTDDNEAAFEQYYDNSGEFWGEKIEQPRVEKFKTEDNKELQVKIGQLRLGDLKQYWDGDKSTLEISGRILLVGSEWKSFALSGVLKDQMIDLDIQDPNSDLRDHLKARVTLLDPVTSDKKLQNYYVDFYYFVNDTIYTTQQIPKDTLKKIEKEVNGNRKQKTPTEPLVPAPQEPAEDAPPTPATPEAPAPSAPSAPVPQPPSAPTPSVPPAAPQPSNPTPVTPAPSAPPEPDDSGEYTHTSNAGNAGPIKFSSDPVKDAAELFKIKPKAKTPKPKSPPQTPSSPQPPPRAPTPAPTPAPPVVPSPTPPVNPGSPAPQISDSSWAAIKDAAENIVEAMEAPGRPVNQAYKYVSAGSLINGTSLLEKVDKSDRNSGLYINLVKPTQHYGTFDLIVLIAEVGKWLKAKFNIEMMVNAISEPQGQVKCRAGGSCEHRNGLNADLAYLTSSRDNVLSVNNNMIGANGKLNPHFLISEQWELFKLMYATGRLKNIITDVAIKKALCEHAVKKGEVKSAKDKGPSAQLLRILFADPYRFHRNHFHVTLTCGTFNRTCLDRPHFEDKLGIGCNVP